MHVIVTRCGGNKLGTTVYRKATHTGRYLHFNSNNLESVKRSVAVSLFRRLNYVILGEAEKQAETNTVVAELQSNGYPRHFIEQSKRVALRKKKQNMEAESAESNATASIPYVRGVSEAVARILRPLDIRTVMQSHQRKPVLMHVTKDRLPADTQPGVVYALGCKDCPKIYIGETARTAKKRTEEHLNHAKKGNIEMSAVAQHTLSNNHAIH